MINNRFKVFAVSLALGLSSVSGSAHADAWDTRGCNTGTQVTSGVSLKIDGTDISGPTGAKANEYAGGYVVNVCRDTDNSTYVIYVSNINNPKNYLYDADANRIFSVSFTPDAADTPQIVEGHAHIQSFTVDAAASNKVTVDMKPINWSDIHGGTGSVCEKLSPAACVNTVTKADEDFTNDLRVGVRYGTEFAPLNGMTWSAGAYYFWMRTGCPALNGGYGDGLTFELGGPHFKTDGTTVNTGFATVFIPNAAIAKCFGGTAADFVAKTLITRTEGSTTEVADTAATQGTGLHYTLTPTATGLQIDIPTVTFSQPTYKMTKARSVKTKAAIIKASHIKKKAGGSTTVTVKTPKYCSANGSAVFGIKKGKCKVTVTSYKATGAKYKSKTYSFKVK